MVDVPTTQRVEVTFVGSFHHGLNSVEVETTLIAARIDPRRIEMRFGPFDIPFTSAGNVSGVFRGRAFATNGAFDGRAEEQDRASAPEVELTVLPSIVVRAPSRSMSLRCG